jgi:ankyrin repeat protein
VWKIICEACSRIPQQEVICIIDALDECSEFSRKRFIDMMLSTFMVPSAKKTAGFLKVLVTSRPWLEIEEQFGPDSSIRLRGEDETNALNNDIGMVVEHRIKDFKTRGILSTMTGEVVKRILNEKADGTFLWISLVLESIISLKSYTPSAIESRLTGIPKDLDALYARALPESDDNTDAEKSRKLLSILLAATRPLELGEIGICLSLNSTTTKLCHMEEEPNIDRAVKGFGGFFIRIANKKVSLVHQTAREYLLRNNGATPDKFWKHSISNFESNLTLAWSCLQFLLLQDWVEYLETLENVDPMNYSAHLANVFLASQGSFYHYAAVNWLRHVEATSVNHESPPELRNIITKLCDQSKVPFATWWSFFKSQQGYSGSSSLHWAAVKGNLLFLKESFRANPLQMTTKISGILVAAVIGNQCQVLDWISLKFGANQLDTKPALIQAIRNREVSVVEQIIKISLFDINGKYLGETPLEVAVEEGDMAIIQLLVKRGVDPCDEEAFRKAIQASRQDIMSFLLETIGGDDPHKRAKLLLLGLETTVIEDMDLEMFKPMMDQGLALPRPYKEPFKLADAAYRHDASSVLQLIGDDIPDERGIALILGSHEPEVLGPLLAVGNYETKQIWEAFRYLDCGTARLYRKLLAPRLSGSDRNFDFTTKRSSFLAINTSRLLATNTSPKKRDGCLQLFLRKLTGLNRHFSNNAITDLLSCDGDMEQFIPIHTLIAMLDKTVPETAASFFTLAFVCGAEDVIHDTSSCLKVNLKDRHGMTPLLAAVLARSDDLSSYLLDHGANPGIISWYTAGLDEPTVEDSAVSKESSEFAMIDQEGGSGGLSLSMLGDLFVSTDQTWESIWDILGRDTFVESPLSLSYKDSVKPFASEDDARLFREDDDHSPATFQILLEDQPTEVVQYSLGFLQYKMLCEGWNVDMFPLLNHLEEPSLAFFNDVPTKLILSTPYAPKLNLSGCTALHLAAKHGLDSLILELLQREQSATAVDQDGRTPLHLYTGMDIATIETLLCSGASLAAVDDMGRTPLHEAVMKQKLWSFEPKRLVECLIEAGAAPLARDASGLTPLHYCIQTAKTIQSTEIIEALVKGMIRTGGSLTTRYDDGLTVLEFAEKMRQQAFERDEDTKAMDGIIAALNKVGTWGYSGLDQDEICGFYESMKAWDPSRADPCELDWLSEDDTDEAELA